MGPLGWDPAYENGAPGGAPVFFSSQVGFGPDWDSGMGPLVWDLICGNGAPGGGPGDVDLEKSV